jgi:nucleoside-diphosphate-sugar epimerase
MNALIIEVEVARAPEHKIEYKPDYRQAIADSWPKDIDHSITREEWGWKPDYDLQTMVSDMLRSLHSHLE